ncbi:MAG: rhodanese-like domain-containing protein [Bacteroidota bacterium]|nr:rhodanese-like domain-containing protein [Bacteroidota bacterium]
MKKHSLKNCCVFLFLIIALENASAQNPINWTKDQLIEPSALAATIKSGKKLPFIFSVGPGAVIPNSIDIGMVKDESNMAKFKASVSKLPKSANIVLYCGCCPFEPCPNVRPALAFLKSEKYNNYHLLNLPHNIKTDWISKGYPSAQ